MSEQPDTLVVLPTYNEAATLRRVVEAILTHNPTTDVLIVDDASPDGTGRIADDLAEQHARVTVEHREAKLGLGTAYILGFRVAIAADYRFVVEMDADGSHLSTQLPRLLERARGAEGEVGFAGNPPAAPPGTLLSGLPDLVIGARWINGGTIVNWPLHRRIISRTGTAVARVALKSRLRDITSGFRVFRTDRLRSIDLDRISSQGYGFQVEVAWLLERSGCGIAEVPITFVEREGGKSKMSLGIVAEALFNVVSWGFDLRFRPGRLLTFTEKFPTS